MSEYQYETLGIEQWPELVELFARIGRAGACPSPSISQVRVARHEGRIVSFLVGQLVPHAEPLWIEEGHRGKVKWLHMLHELEASAFATLGQYFVFAPDERIAAMCEAAGMKPLDWKIFVKEAPRCHS